MSDRRSLPVVAAVLYTAVGAFPLFAVGAYSVRLQQELGFGAARYGIAISLYFATLTVVSPFLGRVVERVEPRTAMRAAALCSCVAMLGLAAVASSWAALAALLCLAAVANSWGQLAANLVLARGVLPGRRGAAFGLKQSAVPLAGLLAGSSLPFMSAVIGWRQAFALLALLPAAALWLAPDVGRRQERNPGAAAGPGTRTRRPELFVLAVAAAIAGATGNSLAMFVVGAAIDRGYGEAAASALLAGGSGVTIAMRLLAGWIVDRRGGDGKVELYVLMLCGSAGFGLLALSGAGGGLFVPAVLIAFGAGWGWPGVLNYHVVRRFQDTPGTATGTVMAGTFLGTIAGPAAIGALATHGSYPLGWALASVLLAVSAAVIRVAGFFNPPWVHGPARPR